MICDTFTPTRDTLPPKVSRIIWMALKLGEEEGKVR
jgi:hypothetical protein